MSGPRRRRRRRRRQNLHPQCALQSQPALVCWPAALAAAFAAVAPRRDRATERCRSSPPAAPPPSQACHGGSTALMRAAKWQRETAGAAHRAGLDGSGSTARDPADAASSLAPSQPRTVSRHSVVVKSEDMRLAAAAAQLRTKVRWEHAGCRGGCERAPCCECVSRTPARCCRGPLFAS